MSARQDGRLSAWARLFEALGTMTSKIVWLLVAVVVLAALGRYLYIAAPGGQPSARQERRTTVSLQPLCPGMPLTTPWSRRFVRRIRLRRILPLQNPYVGTSPGATPG